MNSPYTFQLFDSKNTCIDQIIPLARTISIAREIARRHSFNYHHVIVNNGTAWEEYEKGERVSWSVEKIK